MPESIMDGTGTQRLASVDGRNRLEINGVTSDRNYDASLRGEAFNVNTGNETITAETALLYIKNTSDDREIIVESIFLGIGSAATQSDSAELYVVADPTAGTTISGATAVDMNFNRNLGSAATMTGLFYKGASGETLTGGTDVAVLYHGTGRLFAAFDFIIPPNKAFGLRLDPSLSSGNAKVYAGVACYLRDSTETT